MLHIYRVEDPTTRKSKVVHRNFLLPVNFLPLEEPGVESTMFSTVSEEEVSETKDQGHRSLLSSERESRSNRIAAWVLQGQGPKPSQPVRAHSVQGQGTWQVTGVHASASTDHMRHGGPSITNEGSKPSKLSSDCDTDDVQESEWSADDLSSASESDSASEGIDEEERPGGSVNSHSVQAEPVTMPRESSSDNRSDHCSRVQASSSRSRVTLKASPRKVTGSDTIPKASERTVRTRSGRLVKPVKRLLECMSMILSEPNQRDPLAELLRVLSSFVGS